MQREENIVEKTIKQMEQQDASANLKDMKVNIAFVHRFIRKHAIAYHPYIDFWGLEERYQGYEGQQQGPQNTHMFNEPKDATFGSYYRCFLWLVLNHHIRALQNHSRYFARCGADVATLQVKT